VVRVGIKAGRVAGAAHQPRPSPGASGRQSPERPVTAEAMTGRLTDPGLAADGPDPVRCRETGDATAPTVRGRP